MAEYVICAACGTRIKTGRAYCLRCFEPLALPDTPASIFQTLGWSRQWQLTAGAIASVTVLALLAVIWRTKPPAHDEVAHPVLSPTAAAALPCSKGVAEKVTSAAASPQEPVHAGSEGDEEFFIAPRSTGVEGEARDKELLIHFKLAGAAADAHQWTRAIREYGTAASLAQADAFVQYNFALALHRRGDEHDAITAFRKAIALAPEHVLFHLPLAIALENVGQIADAANEYRAFIDAAPHAAEADGARGRLGGLLTATPRDAVPH